MSEKKKNLYVCHITNRPYVSTDASLLWFYANVWINPADTRNYYYCLTCSYALHSMSREQCSLTSMLSSSTKGIYLHFGTFHFILLLLVLLILLDDWFPEIKDPSPQVLLFGLNPTKRRLFMCAIEFLALNVSGFIFFFLGTYWTPRRDTQQPLLLSLSLHYRPTVLFVLHRYLCYELSTEKRNLPPECKLKII